MILFMTSVQTLYLLDFNNYSNQQTMKKNEIFTFTAPNGAEVTAVVVHTIFQGSAKQLDICYAQNRLFTLVEWEIAKDKGFEKELIYNGETIVDYCVLPEYDAMLEDYYYQHEENVKNVQGFGYTKAEASNILEGKNPDGTKFEKLPF